MDERSLAIERIERAALTDLHAAAPAETRAALEFELEPVGTALVSIAGRRAEHTACGNGRIPTL